MPADVLSRLPSYSTELQDINHIIPVQTITIAAVQTRSASIRIARDLIDMAARAKNNEDYQELIKKIEKEQNSTNWRKTIHTENMQTSGAT